MCKKPNSSICKWPASEKENSFDRCKIEIELKKNLKVFKYLKESSKKFACHLKKIVGVVIPWRKTWFHDLFMMVSGVYVAFSHCSPNSSPQRGIKLYKKNVVLWYSCLNLDDGQTSTTLLVFHHHAIASNLCWSEMVAAFFYRKAINYELLLATWCQ